MVTLPGSTEAVPLTAVQHLPAGTVIDTRQGSITLSGTDGKPGTFTGGAFVVRQTTGPNASTVLQLTAATSAPAPRAAPRPRRSTPPVAAASCAGSGGRDHHGRFGTQGRDASASVRGTVWADRRSLRRHALLRQGGLHRRSRRDASSHVVVRAGHSYLVRHKP